MPPSVGSRRDALVAALPRRLLGTAVIALACLGFGCDETGGRVSAAAAQARAVTQAYLDALARGDGGAACRLVSPAVISDTGDYPTRAACARELSNVRELGHFPIVEVELRSPTSAIVWIDARPYSDTGFDNLPVQRYGDRWLLEGT